MAVAHVWTSRTLDAEELADLYEWLDRVPLSKPRSNVEKDFADGTLAAEIVRFYYPDLVDFRIIRPALSLQERTDQWKLLNSEIFEKVGLTVPSHVLTQLSISKSGIAQIFLYNLRMSLALTGAQTQLFPPPQFLLDPRLNGASYPVHSNAKSFMYNPLWALGQKGHPLPYIYPPYGMPQAEYEAAYLKATGVKPGSQSNRSNGSQANGSQSNRGSNQMQSPSQKSFASSNGDKSNAKNGKAALPPVNPFVPYPVVNASVSLNQTKSELNEKTKKLQEKEDEVNELKAQMKRMEQMVQNKNSKIQELNLQIEKLNTARGKETSPNKFK